ncbi:MAG: TRAP transporter large permease [Rhodospirillales bacterium]|jgi:tripartite ATP-independent transporter DctM subunit|nr:TRAP transporter large permease [Rhodospirillales bacterium]
MIVLLASFAVCLVIGMPIAYALGFSGGLYFLIHHPELLSILPQRVYSGMDSYLMIALPLFVLMGLLMNQGGLTARLIDFCMVFVGRMRGGLAQVNVLASMVFGGISGSSVSDTASIGAVLIPEMEHKGYSREFASGITVASSTMGMIIPPSIPMVIYAFIAEESVGRLFLGGLIPGVLIGVLMLAITYAVSVWRGYPIEDIALSPRDFVVRTSQGIPALLMPVFVVGSVVIGIVTATESAAVGAAYAMLIGMFWYGSLKLRQVPALLKEAILTSANVMIIIAFSSIYIWILALEHVPEAVGALIAGLDLPPLAVLLIVDVVILVIGTFIDVSPAILLLTPVFLPGLVAMGVSPIQFGAIMITGLAVGLVTPPVGMCLNVCSAISHLEIGTIFRAALPFLLANLLTLLLITLVPELSLWLPSVLMD